MDLAAAGNKSCKDPEWMALRSTLEALDIGATSFASSDLLPTGSICWLFGVEIGEGLGLQVPVMATAIM